MISHLMAPSRISKIYDSILDGNDIQETQVCFESQEGGSTAVPDDVDSIAASTVVTRIKILLEVSGQ